MKISLVTVGKTDGTGIREAVTMYESRIARYAKFELIETSEEKLASVLEKQDRVFLLDDTGTEYSSTGFADFMNKQMVAGYKSIAFAVGGPFGFSDEVRACADASISLSRMTFPHDLVRVIFLEQLYRAFTILRNEKYHHQ